MKHLLRWLLAFAPIGMMAQAPVDPKIWTPKDIVYQENISEVVFSPDGQKIAWVKRRPSEKKDKMVSDLYLTRLTATGLKEVRLTRSEDTDHTPVFSADGETLYFLSSRNEGNALWSLSLWGGEPQVVDSFPNGISDLKRMNDSTLLFLSEEGESFAEMKAKKKKDDSEAIEDTAMFKPMRVFAFNTESKTVRRLTTGRFPVDNYAVSKNGQWLATRHIRSPHFGVDGLPKPAYVLWDLKSGTSRAILQSGIQSPEILNFPEDNSGFYFADVLSSDPEWMGSGDHLLYFFDLASMSVKKVDTGTPWGIGEGVGFIPKGNDLWVLLAEGAYNRLALVEKTASGWKTTPVLAGNEMDRHLMPIACSTKGDQLVVAHSSSTSLPEFRLLNYTSGTYRIDTGKVLAEINPGWKKKGLTQAKVVYWKGAKNEQVDGILYYPADYQSGKQYPIVVAIHGGPSGTDLDAFESSWGYYPQINAQKGAFTLMPNYHGSSNHGLAFVESIKGHYYELEVPDILKGVDSLIAAGMVHPDSQAVMGWSNGAILTTALILAAPDRFKVASAGAGDVNWTSDYGTCEFGVTFDQSYFKGAPWDDTKKTKYNPNYIDKSPLFEAEKIKTPVLLFHGSDDRAVPRDQSHEFYRALQQIGKAPVRFIWFPGEPHGLRKLSHQMRKLEEEIAWIDRWLYGKKPEAEVLKEGSPLFVLMEQEKTAHSGALLGSQVQGTLVPETAPLGADTVSVGVYEVTNAQFQAYSPAFVFGAGKENYPAAGITLDQAKGYVAWLSGKTGSNYRLPNSAEAKAWQELALETAEEENTLNNWLGYSPTPEDASKALASLSGLRSSLLKPCGSFPPTKAGQARLYDLGGNVAEWFAEGTASGTYGYSAYDVVDPAADGAKTPAPYVGLRVVKE